MGVFATRSPFRPNEIGLSAVRLIRVEQDKKIGPTLIVGGADLLNGTPILDIKPYLPQVDCHPEAKAGFSVRNPGDWLKDFPEEKKSALLGVLAQDPRPAYQEDSERIYGMKFAGCEVKFRVTENVLEIVNIEM